MHESTWIFCFRGGRCRRLSRVVWPARMELLGKDPLFLLDGAHNPQCAEALAEALSMLTPEKKAVFITGVLADKDYPAMLAKTIPFAGHCICVTPKSDRALPAEQLSNYLKNQGIDATAAKCIDDAILMALEMAQGEIIVAFWFSVYGRERFGAITR